MARQSYWCPNVSPAQTLDHVLGRHQVLWPWAQVGLWQRGSRAWQRQMHLRRSTCSRLDYGYWNGSSCCLLPAAGVRVLLLPCGWLSAVQQLWPGCFAPADGCLPALQRTSAYATRCHCLCAACCCTCTEATPWQLLEPRVSAAGTQRTHLSTPFLYSAPSELHDSSSCCTTAKVPRARAEGDSLALLPSPHIYAATAVRRCCHLRLCSCP